MNEKKQQTRNGLKCLLWINRQPDLSDHLYQRKSKYYWIALTSCDARKTIQHMGT